MEQSHILKFKTQMKRFFFPGHNNNNNYYYQPWCFRVRLSSEGSCRSRAGIQDSGSMGGCKGLAPPWLGFGVDPLRLCRREVCFWRSSWGEPSPGPVLGGPCPGFGGPCPGFGGLCPGFGTLGASAPLVALLGRELGRTSKILPQLVKSC